MANAVQEDRLQSFIQRIEKLEEDKEFIKDDIKEVYAEAKAAGFEPKIMRKVIRLRKMDDEKRREEEQLLDLYLGAVEGMTA
jgi:uncharacterized protein (UPF0335 family)